MRLVERLTAPLLFFLLAAIALILTVYYPEQDWDMIGYIGAAKSFEEGDFESLHSFTFNQVRRLVSGEQYEKLVHDGYRRAMSTDASAFKEQLPFYQIRPVYTGLLYLSYRIGFNIGFATYMVSGAAVVIAIAILYLMSVSFLAKPLIFAVPPLAVIFGMLDLATKSTPDGLAFLAVILSTYLYLKKRFVLLLILLPLMIGIRTDLILFTLPLSLFIFFFERSSRWKAGLSIFLSIAIYVGIGAYWENPGWSTIFYVTLVKRLNNPISIPPVLTTRDYFYALLSGTKRGFFNCQGPLYSPVVGSGDSPPFWLHRGGLVS